MFLKPGMYIGIDGKQWFASEITPLNDHKVRCAYCNKVMVFQGSEIDVKKDWIKRGISTANSLKETGFPLYLCPDADCGGINILEGVIIKEMEEENS